MENNKNILGIHYGHDATVAYIKEGKFQEIMSEERLSRQKKHMGFPHLSLSYIKEKYSIDKIEKVYLVGDTDSVDSNIFLTVEDNKKIRSQKTKYKDYILSLQYFIPGLDKVLDFYYFVINFLHQAKLGKKVRHFLNSKLPGTQTVRLHHHYAHAWSTVPFIKNKKEKHLIFTLDGAGDSLSGTVNIFDPSKNTIDKVTDFPFYKSLGLVYSSIVDILGMSRNEHEFKVMGLAPYAKVKNGEEVYQELKKVIWFDNEALKINTSIRTTKATPYFISKNFHRYRFDSLAYGVQKLTEEIIKQMVRAYIKKYNIRNIALGGGVFMNVKANQQILEMEEVDNLTITPSSGDESLAIGVASYGFVKEGGDIAYLNIENLYLGSEYSEEQIKTAIKKYDFKNDIEIKSFDKEGEIEKYVASLLANNNVVGRFSGRSEWGARALGNRSILANPSSRENIKIINEMIKGRDFWMPFATSILSEDSNEYLENNKNFFAPYMSVTFNTKKIAEDTLAAALHPYDLTSRPQMVDQKMNPKYHSLISEFKKITNISGVLNTSFNLHGEPNVEAPYDAIRTFDLSGLKYLAIGNTLIIKK